MTSDPTSNRRPRTMAAAWLLGALLGAPAGAQDESPPPLAETLAASKAWLKDKDPVIRRNTLRELGEAWRASEEAPSRDLAELVAKALKDKDLGVQAEAALQLGLGLHAEVAAEALPPALKQARREIPRLRKDAGKGSPSVSTQVEDGVRRPAGRPGEVQRYLEALLEGLGRVPDERSVRALLAFGATPYEEQVDRLLVLCAEALLACGDQQAVAGVLDLMEDLEKELRRRDPEGAADDEEGATKTTLSSSMRGGDVFRIWFPAPDRGTLRELGAALVAFAEGHALPAGPEEGSSEAWREWFGRVRETLPERAGKVSLEDSGISPGSSPRSPS